MKAATCSGFLASPNTGTSPGLLAESLTKSRTIRGEISTATNCPPWWLSAPQTKSWIWLTVPPLDAPRYRHVEPGVGSREDGSSLVLRIAAATLDLVGSHLLHSILPSLFLLSPLTETPFTAFLVQRFLPSLLTPQTIGFDLFAIPQLLFGGLGNFALIASISLFISSI